MSAVARVLAGTVALLVIGFGLLYMLSPEGRLEDVDLQANTNLGLATVRAFIGGGLLAFTRTTRASDRRPA